MTSEVIKVYCETTEERMFDGKLITLTVRANRPSQEALKRYAQTIVRIVRQCEERGQNEYNEE